MGTAPDWCSSELHQHRVHWLLRCEKSFGKQFCKDFRHFRENRRTKFDFAHRLDATARPGDRELGAVKISASYDAWRPPKRQKHGRNILKKFVEVFEVFARFFNVFTRFSNFSGAFGLIWMRLDLFFRVFVFFYGFDSIVQNRLQNLDCKQ